jgi:hypothetical protein
VTGEDRKIADVNQCKIITLLRVEVRRVVIVKEHFDDNAEEPANPRREHDCGAKPGKRLQASCPWLSGGGSPGKDQLGCPKRVSRMSQSEPA